MAETERKTRYDAVLNRLYEHIQAVNVADDMDETELRNLGQRAIQEYNLDLRSRSDWEETAKRAMDIALQARKPKNYPFQGASNVKWPLVTVAALQFNARAYPAIVDGDGVVKAKVTGSDEGIPVQGQDGQPVVDPQTGEPEWQMQPGAKQSRADRISEHMSYQLLEEMEEWEEDTDTLLMQLPIVGCAFRKVYWDSTLNRPRSEMSAAIDVVVNQSVRSLEEAPRISHRFEMYPQQIEERKRVGLFLDIDLGQPANADGDEDAPHEFIEQHRFMDLDDDGYDEPYIVTVHCETDQVVRIVANFGEDDITLDAEGRKILRIAKRDYFVKYGFIPDPKGGFYDIGFGSLLESLGEAIDTTINQMLDAGHLQNAGGGFIGSGVRMKKNYIRFEPGVYHSMNATGTTLRENIVSMDHPGPSTVLFSLLGMMIEAAKDITAVKDIFTGGDQQSKDQTATTTLALIEQGMKVFTAIYKRIYRSMKREFKLLYRVNAENLPEQAYFNVMDTPKAIARSDYEPNDYDICPLADPRLVTDMQRLARAQLLLEFREDPLVNQMEIRRRFFMAAGIEDVDQLLVPPEPGPAEQLAVADAEAEIAQKQAETEKTQTESAKNVSEINAREEERVIKAMEAVGPEEPNEQDNAE